MSTNDRIHILHENDAWTAPLHEALDERGLPYTDWHLAQGYVDTQSVPPTGVFYNRMSASAHTRDHAHAPELTRHVLAWLESHGRRVINNSRALALEVSKVAQYVALDAAGIRTPRTLAAVGRDAVLDAAHKLDQWPFILKPNRGGTGAGVQRIDNEAQLATVLDDPETGPSLDGTWLVQEYIRAFEPAITRCEFIGGEFAYAVRVDTSEGFDLCPADACELPAGREKFEILEGLQNDALLAQYTDFLAANGVEVAALEYIVDGDGRLYTYDVNTNTNYNRRAESRAGRHAMGQLADFLGRELQRQSMRGMAASSG